MLHLPPQLCINKSCSFGNRSRSNWVQLPWSISSLCRRKSLPLVMMSDNASTYIDSADSLKELFPSPSPPKHALCYGGFLEGLVALTKRVITVGRTPVTFMELQILVAEATLNDHQRTYVSSDIWDEENPNHYTPFDYGITSDDLTAPNYSDGANIRRRSRRKPQAFLLQRFRNKWKHKYLTSLREFYRTIGNNQQIY